VTPWRAAFLLAVLYAVGAAGQSPTRPGDPESATVIVDDMVFHHDQLTSVGVDGRLATSVFSASVLPWPGGVLPIDFDASVTAAQRNQFLQNCNLWGSRPPTVACVVRTTEAVALNVFSRGLPFRGGQSTVGYSPTFRRELTITPDAWFDSLILHEVGHAFGFMHEHQRHDRDSYVTIDASNIAPGYTGAFTVLSAATSQVYGVYDFLSVMHYAPNSFAVDPSRPNIIAKPPYQQFQALMGRATRLSELDLGGIVAIYGVAPDRPIGPRIATGSTSVRLSWTPAPSGGSVAYYLVRAGRAPGLADLGRFNVGLTTSVAANLAPATYYVAVTAVNERGASAPTDEVSFTLTGAPPPPAAPVLEVIPAGNTLSLSWTQGNGGEASAFVLQAGSTSGAADLYSASVGTSTSLQAQVPLRTYFLRVLAQNSAGTATSNEVRVDVTAVCTAPAAPVLQLSRLGRIVTASWTLPAGGPIGTYVLQAGRGPGATDLFNAPVGTSRAISGTLAPGTYYVRVFGVSACASGPTSNEAVIQVP
jgi:hypothetical protein